MSYWEHQASRWTQGLCRFFYGRVELLQRFSDSFHYNRIYKGDKSPNQSAWSNHRIMSCGLSLWESQYWVRDIFSIIFNPNFWLFPNSIKIYWFSDPHLGKTREWGSRRHLRFWGSPSELALPLQLVPPVRCRWWHGEEGNTTSVLVAKECSMVKVLISLMHP
jgi:hypothetical protein